MEISSERLDTQRKVTVYKAPIASLKFVRYINLGALIFLILVVPFAE